MLIQAAGSDRFRVRVRREQLPMQEVLVRPIRDTAWIAATLFKRECPTNSPSGP
jgi:hypothetical protein